MSEFSKREKEENLLWEMNETIGLDDRETPEEGYLYSVDKSIEVRLPDEHFSWAAVEEEIRNFINQNLEILKQPGYFVGVWHHDNSHYIEAVRVTESEAEALIEAKKNGQQAVYDLKNKKIIYL